MPRCVIALDTETLLFGPGNMTPEPVLATTCDKRQGAQLWHGDGRMRELCERLSRSDCLLIGVNIAYDARVLARHVCGIDTVLGWYRAGRVVDIALVQRQLAIADLAPKRGIRSESLASLARLHGVECPEKDPAIRLTFGEHRFPAELPAAHRDYALGDAAAPLEVFRRQWAAAEGKLSLESLAQWSYAHFGASLMTADGIETVPEAADRLEVIATAEADRMQRVAWEAGFIQVGYGVRAFTAASYARQPSLPGIESWTDAQVGDALEDPTSDLIQLQRKPVQELVMAAYGGAPPMTERPKKAGPNWRPSVKIDAETLANSGDPTLEQLATLLEARKALRADVPLLRKGWLHSRIDFANTGRLQASGPNLMNMGKSGLKALDGRVAPTVRECLAVPPGMCWLVADYPSLEFVTLAAHLAACGFPETSRRLREGRARGQPYDPHVHSAAVSLGLSYDEARARYVAGDKAVKAARQRCKPATYGFPVGMAPATFVRFCAAMGVVVTEAEAVEIRDVWAGANPDQVALQAQHKRSRNGAGLYRMQPIGTGHAIEGGTFCATLNASFQGPGAAIAHECLRRFAGACWARDERYPHLTTAKLKMFTHDEAVLHAPLVGRAAAARDVEQLMTDAAVHVLGDLGRVLRPQCVALDLYSKDEARHVISAESQ